MSENPTPKATSKSKRGRKPLGDRALTASELKRRSREKLAQQGEAEFTVRLSRGTLNLVDQIADASDVTRSQVIASLLDMALAKLTLAVAEADQLQAAGTPAQEVEARLRAHLGAIPSPELIEKYKEVRGL